MSLTLLTAVGDPEWEAGLVAALDRTDVGVQVVRRCVDLADLLAAATAGLGRAALVSADLRQLDRDALTRLAVAGVAVVGVHAPDDATGERRLRQLGIGQLLAIGTTADAVAAAVAEAVSTVARSDVRRAPDYADPAAPLPPPRHPTDDVPAYPDEPPGFGRVIAVWGPIGAPGRSSVSVGLAAELAELGLRTLLVDADVYGGAVAPMLGVLDEAPGLAGACRLATNGTLDIAGLAELALVVRPNLRVLTGIARAERWPELRPSAVAAVLGLARGLADVTVVDCGFCLEQDEELSFDTVAPRRNGATLAVLESADDVIAVASADPLGLQRFVRGLTDLREAVPAGALTIVVNKVRTTAIGGGNPRSEIAAALERFAGVSDAVYVPDDRPAFDAALVQGRTLPESAPHSPARAALRGLAQRLNGTPTPLPRGRLFRRGVRRSRAGSEARL